MSFVKVFTHKSDMMEHIQRLAGKEYCFYTQGSIEERKLAKTLAQFDACYDITLSTQQRTRIKSIGRASVKLVLFQPVFKKRIYFYLMATKGASPVFELEDMKSLKGIKSRLMCSDGTYELFKYRANSNQKKGKGGIVNRWSWRYTKSKVSETKANIENLVKRGDMVSLKKVHRYLNNTAGFNGDRQQAFTLYKDMKKMWKRYQKSDFPLGNINPLFRGRKMPARKRVVELKKEPFEWVL